MVYKIAQSVEKIMTAKVELNRWLTSHQATLIVACDFIIIFLLRRVCVCVCALTRHATLSPFVDQKSFGWNERRRLLQKASNTHQIIVQYQDHAHFSAFIIFILARKDESHRNVSITCLMTPYLSIYHHK